MESAIISSMMHRFVSSGVRNVLRLQVLSGHNVAMMGSVYVPNLRFFSKKAGANATKKEEQSDSTPVEEEYVHFPFCLL